MIVCGTGHRPNKLGGYGQEVTEKLVRIAVLWLAENQPKRVITGMALGWDQALALAARELGIPYICAVPFVGMQDKWPQESKNLYIDILSDAFEIVYVSDPPYAAYKMQVRNEWMVDRADAVLALWDGSDGGTGNCIRYATKKEKQIVNLWDSFNA